AFGVKIPFAVADVRALAAQVPGTFDTVLACDNALPHLLTDADLQSAVENIVAKLRPGGLFIASTRDYDALVKERPRVTPPRVFDGPDGRRISFQVWDWWPDGKGYRFQQLFVRQAADGWHTTHYGGEYRALLRDEFSAVLRRAGFAEIYWRTPEACG